MVGWEHDVLLAPVITGHHSVWLNPMVNTTLEFSPAMLQHGYASPTLNVSECLPDICSWRSNRAQRLLCCLVSPAAATRPP